MKFIAHNHYNNNSDGLGDFENPPALYALSETPVNITNKGLTIFLLGKVFDQEQKLVLLKVLHTKLKGSEGHGIDFATCATSDCVVTRELEPFFSGVKRVDDNIGTIWVGRPMQNVVADYPLGAAYKKPNGVVSIIDPKSTDMAEPAKGWSNYEDHLKNIYHAALLETVPQAASDRDLQARLGLPRQQPAPR